MINPFLFALALWVLKITLTLAAFYQFRRVWDMGSAAFAGPVSTE